MSWRRTLLAGFMLVLVCMLNVLDKRIITSRTLADVNKRSLAPGINLSEVVEVHIESPAGKVHLQKENGNWRMKVPVEAVADSEVVETLLTNVTAANLTNEIEVKNLAEYGLASPEVTATFKTADKTFGLATGNESTYTGLVYAKYLHDRKVFTVGQQVKNVMLRPPMEYRRTRLLDVDVANLDAYTAYNVRSPEKVVTLRNNTGEWRIAEPVQGPAEAEVVRDHLRKLGLLRASGFVTRDSDKPTSLADARQALSSPTLVLTLDRANKSPQTLVVGLANGPSGAVYVAQRQGDEEILVLRSETVNDLRTDHNYFRSRTIFTLKPNQSGVFSVEIGRSRTDLVRNEAGNWEFVGDSSTRVDQNAVNNRLDVLLASRVRDYVDADAANATSYGFVNSRMLRYMVSSRDKSRTETIEVGKAVPGQQGAFYARRAGDSAVFTMEIPADLFISPATVADKHFARLDPKTIARFEITLNQQKYELRRKEGVWEMLRPGQTVFASVETPKVDAVFSLMGDMTYIKDYSGGDTMITPAAEQTFTFKALDEKDKPLLDMSVGKRLQGSTMINSGKDHHYEVNNQDLDRLTAAIQTLVR